jgi:GNAT superfamily N-acetyltransferase
MTSLLPDDDEHLATGWEPELDPTDSVVRQAVFAHASWAVQPARMLGRPWRDGPAWAGAHVGDKGALTNWVVLKQPGLDLARVIGEVDELFPAGVPFLLVSPWRTGDLSALDLGLVGHPPLMFRPWAAEAAPSAANPRTTGVEVRRAADAAALAVAERVLIEGYPMPELQPIVPGSLYADGLLSATTSVFVAFDGDEPVATAVAHSAAGVTLVEAVAVLPQARGKGAGAAVTTAATAAFDGQGAVLLASDDGQPVYARLGYHRLERWTVWLRT